MTTKLVIGVDGSSTSRAALIWATRFAVRVKARLEVVWVWHYPAGVFSDTSGVIPLPSKAEMQSSAETSLQRFLDDCADECSMEGLDWDPIVDHGETGYVLCAAARDADLLIVGSRGLGGFKGLMLGSVGAHCANEMPCPVALIPPSWEPGVPDKGTIVLGVDGSPGAAEAVRWADRWAPQDASLTIASAWNPPISYDMVGMQADEDVFKSACEQTVSEAATLVDQHRVTTDCVRGDARSVLPEAARHADMLVIGARGHRGLERLLIGSVASTIVHHLSVPTVLVPRP